MSELDVLKERIAYLKVLFGILVVTEISLVGWLASNFTEATILIRTAGIIATAALSVTIFAFHSSQNISALINVMSILQCL